jgi:hypothetical protein
MAHTPALFCGSGHLHTRSSLSSRLPQLVCLAGCFSLTVAAHVLYNRLVLILSLVQIL